MDDGYPSTIRGVEDAPEALGEDGWKAADPRAVNQSDADEVSQVGAVLVAVRGEFDAHQGVEVDDTERAEVRGFFDRGVCGEFAGLHDFFSEDQMDRTPWACGWRVEEQVEAERLSIGEASGFEGGLCGGKVIAADEKIDILSVADGGFVDGGDPGGDGAISGYDVVDSCRVERVRCVEQSLTGPFHGVHHPFKHTLGIVGGQGHAG